MSHCFVTNITVMWVVLRRMIILKNVSHKIYETAAKDKAHRSKNDLPYFLE